MAYNADEDRKKWERLHKEIRKMEIEMFKDVEATAKIINEKQKQKEEVAKWLNDIERCLVFMSIHSLITDWEKERIRKRMDKYWKEIMKKVMENGTKR